MATLLSQAPVTVPYAPSLTLPAGTVPVTSPMVGYGHQLPYPNTAKRMNTNERRGWKKNLETAGYAVGGLLISALIVAAMGAAIAHGAVVNLPDLNFNGWGSSGSHSRDSRPNPQQQPV